jgi:hypothetical protein
MGKVIGGIMIAVGILVMTVSGICAGFVIVTTAMGGDAAFMAVPVVVGGIPFLFGLAIVWGGRKLIAEHNRMEREQAGQMVDDGDV